MSINIIFIFIITYCISMFNPAIIICKKKTGEDIRKIGNFDAGIGNAIKIMGKFMGIVICILNILKIFLSYYISVFIARKIGTDVTSGIFKSTIILGCMIGHCFPIIYKFNGGKGIIELLALMLIFDYKYVAICIVAGLLVVAFTKVVTKGTLAGCILYLVLSIILGCNYILALIISLAIILYKHRSNIQRIMTRQEEKI